MKKLSICMLLIIFAIIFMSIGSSFSATKAYNGYSVYYNAEQNTGFIYLNNNSSSALMVAYPSVNETYLYGSEGQMLLDSNVLSQLLVDPAFGVVQSIVAVIKPASTL